MYSRAATMAKAVLMIALLATVGVAQGELLFADDFSSGDFSKHNANFRWGRSGDIKDPTGESKHTTLAIQANGQIGYVMEFTYGTWQEVRFHLTAGLGEERSEDGSSTVAYPELWVRMQMKVPDNYFHELNEKGQAATQNNKGWLSLWKNDYSDAAIMARYEWWPAGRVESEGLGGSYVTAVAGEGHDAEPTYTSDLAEIGTSSKIWAIRPSDRGRWIDFAFHYRVASGPNSRDGLMEIYRDGELYAGWYDKDIWPDDGDPEKAGFDRGYVMGYHNSGYVEETTFYIDNFRIGTTAESVGLGKSQTKAPRPPEVLKPKG